MIDDPRIASCDQCRDGARKASCRDCLAIWTGLRHQAGTLSLRGVESLCTFDRALDPIKRLNAMQTLRDGSPWIATI